MGRTERVLIPSVFLAAVGHTISTILAFYAKVRRAETENPRGGPLGRCAGRQHPRLRFVDGLELGQGRCGEIVHGAWPRRGVLSFTACVMRTTLQAAWAIAIVCQSLIVLLLMAGFTMFFHTVRPARPPGGGTTQGGCAIGGLTAPNAVCGRTTRSSLDCRSRARCSPAPTSSRTGTTCLFGISRFASPCFRSYSMSW